MAELNINSQDENGILTSPEISWGVISHLVTYISWILSFIVAPSSQNLDVENQSYLELIKEIIPSLLVYVIPFLIIALTKGRESTFVRFHIRQAINFFMTAVVFGLLGTLVFMILGFLLGSMMGSFGSSLITIIFVGFVLYFGFWPIRAAIRASDGEYYRYPFCIQFFHCEDPDADNW